MQTLFQTDKVFPLLVNEITDLINEEVIITNESGVIVASTDRSRINDYHEGAFMAMKAKQKMLMTEKLTTELKGVRKGIVLPIIIGNKPLGVVGITGEPDEIESFGKIVQKMSELFIKETIVQMTQEETARNIDFFIFDWINNNMSEEVLKQRSEFFDIRVQNYEQAIVLLLPYSINHLSYKDISFLRNLWDIKHRALFVRWGQGKLVILDKAYDKKRLRSKITHFLESAEAMLGTNVHAGVGQATDYHRLSTSFEQADRASFIAEKEGEIIFEDELKFEMIQHQLDEHIKKTFIERTIAPITEDKTLIETLECWLTHHMSIQETSEALHIHKNTLYYRLNKIEQVAKMDLNNVEHLLLCYMGVKFLKEK